MPPVLAVARMTVREASRRRLLLTLALVILGGVILSAWGFGRLPGITRGGEPLPRVEVLTVASQLLLLVTFMGTFVVAMGAVVAAAPSIAGEIESGVIHALLPRPVRRSHVLLGKWLGLATIVGGFTLVAALLEMGAVRLGAGYWPPEPVQAALYLAAEGVVLVSLALLLSTRVNPMAGGLVSIAAFGVAWIGGVMAGIGQALDNGTIQALGMVSRLLIPSDGLWHGAIWNLEPATLVAAASAVPEAAGNPFFASGPPPVAYLVWVAVWVVAVLGLAVWSFGRREI